MSLHDSTTFCFDCNSHIPDSSSIGLCMACLEHRADGHLPRLICHEELVGMPLPCDADGNEYIPSVEANRRGMNNSYYCHGAGCEGRDLRFFGQQARPLKMAELHFFSNVFTRDALQAGLIDGDDLSVKGTRNGNGSHRSHHQLPPPKPEAVRTAEGLLVFERVADLSHEENEQLAIQFA